MLPPPTGKGCCNTYGMNAPITDTLPYEFLPLQFLIKFTCKYLARDENDPLDYCLVSVEGEEIMSVTGLDGMDSNNVRRHLYLDD